MVTVLIFGVLTTVGKAIHKKIKTSKNRLFNPLEYFPQEEFQTLKQVFYLIMMLIFFVLIIYIIAYHGNEGVGIAVLQIIVSFYVAITLDYSSWKNILLFILLIPYEAIGFLVFNESFLILHIYIIHIFVYLYLMKVYYSQFIQYTERNRLGITILLLFTIVFFSFIITTFVENVYPLDSLVMVSNAFTSNGYAILGKSSIGKLNSIVLVWGGYIISGVGTATLTASILLRHIKKRDEEINKRLDELESLIKNNQK